MVELTGELTLALTRTDCFSLARSSSIHDNRDKNCCKREHRCNLRLSTKCACTGRKEVSRVPGRRYARSDESKEGRGGHGAGSPALGNEE